MINLLKSHTSVRHYERTDISRETLAELLEAGQHASSSHFVQAYSVIHVTDEQKKLQLADLSNNHLQIENAPVVLLFCADLKRLEIVSQMKEVNFEGPSAENFIVSVVDTSLFAQNVAVAAESRGYGICYIGGIRNEIEAVSELFNLPNFVMPLFAMTIGVPAKRNEVKPRMPLQAILHENNYDASTYPEILNEYDEIMGKYYGNRKTNRKNTAWTMEMSRFFEKPRRAHMKEFIEKKGFFLK